MGNIFSDVDIAGKFLHYADMNSSKNFPFKFEHVRFSHDTFDGELSDVPVTLRYYLQATLKTDVGVNVQEQEILVLSATPSPLQNLPLRIEYHPDSLINVKVYLDKSIFSVTDVIHGQIDVYFPKLSWDCVVKSVWLEVHQRVSAFKDVSLHEKRVARMFGLNFDEPSAKVHYVRVFDIDMSQLADIVPTYDKDGGLFSLKNILKVCLETTDGQSPEVEQEFLEETEIIVYRSINH